jgi:TetR/AcrR family transcriptional regulator, tetracycline repressor protein
MPTAPPRTRVTRAAIAREALALIRMDGLGAVTMRAVAERLSIQAPSLYEHVRGKDELLDLLVQESFEDFADNAAEFATVRTLDEWIDLVIAGSLRLRAFYLRHPGLAGLMLRTLDPRRDERDGSRAALVRAQLDALERLGLDPAVARPLFDATVLWSLSAIAGEGLIEADEPAEEREERYRTGLGLVTRGLRAALRETDGATR